MRQRIRNEDMLIAYVESHTKETGKIPQLSAIARFVGVSEKEAERLGAQAIEDGRLSVHPDGNVKARYR